MNPPPESNNRSADSQKVGKLLQSGIILTAASLLGGLGNYAFQAIISRHLARSGEYGLANSTISFAGLLCLPMAIATVAVTHYLARFKFTGNEASLQSLYTGCRKFLLHLTIGGSVLALVLFIPLSNFFHFARPSLMLSALVYVLFGLWGAFATALCQGLAWFKRLALISLLAIGLRLVFGGLITLKFPTAEMIVLAYIVAMLANLVLLRWRKELPRSVQPESPWNPEFIRFFVLAAACIGGGYCFTQGDLLVAKRYFPDADLDAYTAAGVLARALPLAVAPLLTVLFTYRSGQHHGDSVWEQLKLLLLYAVGLIGGAIVLFVLRTFCLKIIARNTPEAADMILRLTLTMVCVGLLQALAMWALASRWLKISLLYGGLGLGYWLVLLLCGKSPAGLLFVMPLTAGLAFILLFFTWLIAYRTHKIGPPE